MGGVSFEELVDASDIPVIKMLLEKGALAGVSTRISNRPSHAYATLGAGERVQAIPSAGWAFEPSESVENGTGEDLYRRRAEADGDGAVFVSTIDQLTRGNSETAFDANLGALAEALEADGILSAAVGNADFSTAPLPTILPDQAVMTGQDPPDPGIHREVALVSMRSDGTVAIGNVSRDLLTERRDAPYRTITSRQKVLEAFDSARQHARFIAVETGDTYRADAAQVGHEQRRAALVRSASILEGVIQRVDLEKDLVLIIAPTTPGGDEARGRLRPAILLGPRIEPGLLFSSSTRKAGLITVPDLTATITHWFSASGARFGSGRALSIAAADDAIATVTTADARSASHDKVRRWWSAALVAFWLLSLWYLTKGRTRSRTALGLAFFPLASLPLSYLTRLAPAHPAWIIVVVTLSGVIGGSLVSRLGVRKGWVAVAVASCLGFAVDLSMGGHLQLDSLLGYTSVAAGRYFGLGNIGYAVFVFMALILAGSVGTKGPFRSFTVIAIASVVLVLLGHPSFGDDVGGTLAAAPAFGILILGLSGRRVRLRQLLALMVVSLGLLAIFGFLDLSRPPTQRTHLGDLMSNVMADPAQFWYIVRRKLLLATTTGVTDLWAILLIPSSLFARHLYRSLSNPPRALTHAVVAAAALGSILNDSGPAVGGVMLAQLASYLLLVRFGQIEVPTMNTSADRGPSPIALTALTL